MTLSAYAGDSLAKRAVRFMMYMDCSTFWHNGDFKPPTGLAVVLAGPEACELGSLRYLLQWPAERTVFVDVDKRGLEVAKAKWKGVPTFHGSVGDFFQSNKEKVAFVHMDFNGHLTEDAMAALRALRGRLTHRAFVALTVLRGREHNEHTLLWPWMKQVGKHAGKKMANKMNVDVDDIELDAARLVGYRSIIGNCIGENKHRDELDMVFVQPYQGHKTPMLSVGCFWLPQAMRGPKWKKAINSMYRCRAITSMKNDYAERFIKHWGLHLRRGGMPIEIVSEVLNVQEGTLTAWLAHDTRGSYDEDPLANKIKDTEPEDYSDGKV